MGFRDVVRDWWAALSRSHFVLGSCRAIGLVLLWGPLQMNAFAAAPGGAERAAPGAGRGRASIVSIDYLSDHGQLSAKDDGPGDPITPIEATPLSSLGPELVVANSGDRARPISHTWGEPIEARVVIDAGAIPGARRPGWRLRGSSASPELVMRSRAVRVDERTMALTFNVVSQTALPTKIAKLEGEVRWRLEGPSGVEIDCGRTFHTVFVTAGPPLAGKAWPLVGAGDPRTTRDHNAPTLFRMRSAVEIAAGTTNTAAAAHRVWEMAMHHYDLDGDPDLNPWMLLAPDKAGQCMTSAAFIEAVVKLLGFANGSVSYVYPSLKKPANPDAIAIAHPLIRGAYTVEAPIYDLRGQFRSVVTGSSGGGHTAQQAAQHRGAHGIERLKMRDFHGGLHNYAAAFVVVEDGARSYFGGGYSVAPYHDAQTFLAAACTAVVWTFEEGTSDEWETICDHPGPGYWWLTGRPFSVDDSSPGRQP